MNCGTWALPSWGAGSIGSGRQGRSYHEAKCSVRGYLGALRARQGVLTPAEARKSFLEKPEDEQS